MVRRPRSSGSRRQVRQNGAKETRLARIFEKNRAAGSERLLPDRLSVYGNEQTFQMAKMTGTVVVSIPVRSSSRVIGRKRRGNERMDLLSGKIDKGRYRHGILPGRQRWKSLVNEVVPAGKGIHVTD